MSKKEDKIFKRKKIPEPTDGPTGPFFRKIWKENMKRLLKDFNKGNEEFKNNKD
ncbi:hypothetical protein NRK67_01655 [Fusobacteria bacterium ZRK30]|nr:hypothetical protein NRK67_01655 [Fusobacteria bacterium ZRK30]